MISKEDLIHNIEEARERLNQSIDYDDGDSIYLRSIELDQLIEQYIKAGY